MCWGVGGCCGGVGAAGDLRGDTSVLVDVCRWVVVWDGDLNHFILVHRVHQEHLLVPATHHHTHTHTSGEWPGCRTNVCVCVCEVEADVEWVETHTGMIRPASPK